MKHAKQKPKDAVEARQERKLRASHSSNTKFTSSCLNKVIRRSEHRITHCNLLDIIFMLSLRGEGVCCFG